MRFLVRNGETGSVVQVDIDGSQTVYDLMRASGGSLGIPASESGRLRASMELDMATPLARLPQGAGTIVLEKNTSACCPPAVAATRTRLNPGETLHPGDSLISSNGRYKFILQEDGNVVLYNNHNKATWASNTNTAYPARRRKLVMQSDCNLVLYDAGERPVWASNTNVHPNMRKSAHLVMQDDGNAVIYDNHNKAIWSTDTWRK